jgi:hypothetical protein
MPINNSTQEPTEDDIYFAKMTMDEVGADIEEHGHIAVTDENRTQDPFTTKGSLANALDEALDYSNPNNDPTNESQGEVEGVTNDPQSPKKSDEEIKPDDTTMDKAPEVPNSLAENEDAKTVKGSLSEALDSAFAMDAVTEVSEEADDEAHHKWQHEEIKKNVPKIPESMGGGDQPDSNGLIYLDYTFTVDPEKYNSPNYQPIADAGNIGNVKSNATKDPNEQATTDKVDEDVSVEETIVEAGGEPSKDAEKVAAKAANEDEKEVASIGKPIEKKAEDEAVEKVVLDYATFIDGSSFMCFDEDMGIDYTKIAMDAGPKKPVTRQTCKTTFAQCRAKNPLFCRFHGPKLLEKDIKSAMAAALGKGCVVSVTKDKGQKNPLTFRLTIGCPPAMKKDVEKIVHMFMTQNPGISSPEEYKDLGNGKQTTEFDMDILKADQPPKKNDLKGQAAQWETEKAKAKGKTMPIVGETPPKVEKLANEGGVQKTEEQPSAEAVEEKVDETEGGNVGHKSKQFEILQKTNPMLDSYHTGIHSVEDIKTFEEALDYEAPTYPDITQKLIDKAKSNGKIKVYSSKPIENGAFVSPSEMCAKDYAGDGEVYSKVLPLADIAWINGDEGQVAIVGGEENVEQPTEKASGSKQGNIGEEENKKFSDLVDEATTKGLFDIEEFKKGYDTIYNDHTTYPTTASQIDALEKLMDETDWESKKPQPTEEEKNKKSYEDEFNAALMEYPEGGAGSDNDAKNIEINEAFTNAFIGNDAEGMKSAIEAMKKLVSDVKGEGGGEGKGDEIQDVLGVLSGLNHEIPDFNISYDAMGAKNPTGIKISAYGNGDFGAMLNKVDSILANVGYGVSGTNGNDMHIVKKGGSDAGENKWSDFHYVDDAAMKMTGEIDDLAHQNPELISSDDNVSALYYAAQYAINAIDDAKKNLEEIDEKLKKMSDESPSASNALAQKALEGVQQVQQETYDSAKANAELSVKNFKEAVEKAKANIVDSIKGTNAEMVENIVKTTARAIFPQGKPDGVDSVADMIDALDEEKVSLINDKLMVNGVVSQEDLSKLHSIENKHSFIKKYKDVEKASQDFNGAVSSFKDLIDGVKSKDGAESLKKAVDGIGEYSQKLKDAFAAYKMAVENVKKDVSDFAEIKEKEKKLSQSSSGNTMDLAGDLAKFVGLDTETDGKYKSASADFYPNLANAISAALQKDGNFTNFNTTTNYDSHNLYLSVEKKQKKGFDEDEDTPEIPTDEEKSNVEYMLQRELGKVGLALAYGTAEQSGPKLSWQIVAKPKKKLGATEKSQPTKQEIADFVSKGFGKNEDFWQGTIEGLTNPNSKTGLGAEVLKGLEKAMVKFPDDHQVVKAIKAGLEKNGIKYNEPAKKIDAASADPKASIKAKIAAMSVKEKMEKSIPILEKKIKAEPNNEKWQKMLKQAKAYLAAHSSQDDDYLE